MICSIYAKEKHYKLLQKYIILWKKCKIFKFVWINEYDDFI